MIALFINYILFVGKKMKIHINENIEVKIGEDAEAIFEKQNDKEFLDNNGVNKITTERWKLAQITEEKHWMVRNITENDDRNFEHCKKFDNYNCIRNIIFNKSIEIGCGPFTNLRIIADIADINNCVLLDPLIDKYLNHDNCRYNKGKLITNSGKLVNIEKLLNIPGEQLLEEHNYDLAVCINVLEHCYDIELFLDNLYRICNGYFIFHDKIFSQEQAKRSVEEIYDAAHPLRVGKELIINFLNNFEKVYEKSEIIENELTGIDQEFIYFVGRKYDFS